MIRKMLIPALLATAFLLPACGPTTVDAEEFLYTYRRNAPPGRSELSWYATYTGRDEDYHYLEVQKSNFPRGEGEVILFGGFREERLRCPLSDLPETFPQDFEALWDNDPADAQAYVRAYMRRHGMDSPEGSGR